jgi:hypothetical protein
MTEDEFFSILDSINRDHRQGRISTEQADAEREALIWRFETERRAA